MDFWRKGHRKMNAITDLHSRMTEVLAGCAQDAAKLDGGNAAAGRRLRKALQELKILAQETRKTSIEAGKAGGSISGSAPTTCDGTRSECGGGGISSGGDYHT